MTNRKYYLDNLRTFAVLMLFPQHSFMPFNNWGETWYLHGKDAALLKLIFINREKILAKLIIIVPCGDSSLDVSYIGSVVFQHILIQLQMDLSFHYVVSRVFLYFLLSFIVSAFPLNLYAANLWIEFAGIGDLKGSKLRAKSIIYLGWCHCIFLPNL